MKITKNSFLERYELIGERALDLTSPFDEMTILNESIDYINATLESTFGLQGVQVKFPLWKNVEQNSRIDSLTIYKVY